ncbi:acid protease [Meredithblackwellia eburnea MCA 4105]
MIVVPFSVLFTLFAICLQISSSVPVHGGLHRRYFPLPKSYTQRSGSTFISLSQPQTAPLTRIAIRNDKTNHLHPLMLFQQHVNRAHKRHALMTGTTPPSDSELERRMRKRWLDVTGGNTQAARTLKLRKRQRVGPAYPGSKGPGGANTLIGQAGQAVPDSSVLFTPLAGGSSIRAIQGNNLALANANGFPQVALDAAKAGSVSKATTPTAAQTLGEDIEANDVGYFTTIQIGTPPKDYRVLVDSGSSDLWVPAEGCTTCGATHTTLGPTSSSTFKVNTTTFSITFGTGQVSGNLAVDDVSIAGLKLPQHQFGVTSAESIDFGDPTVPFDGLMGTAKSQLSTQKTLTPIESLAKTGVTTTSQMGYHLARLTDGPNDGEVTFGGVDSSKFTGTLLELDNVSPVGFWEGAMSDISVNGASLNMQGRTAILDTGTTLMIVPLADATAIHAAIPGAATDGQGGFAVPCNNTAIVALAFQGQSFTINPADLAFVPVNQNQLNGLCISGIAAGQVGAANQWLVGDTFLKNVYYATDVANNKIGLAPALTAIPAAGGDNKNTATSTLVSSSTAGEASTSPGSTTATEAAGTSSSTNSTASSAVEGSPSIAESPATTEADTGKSTVSTTTSTASKASVGVVGSASTSSGGAEPTSALAAE